MQRIARMRRVDRKPQKAMFITEVQSIILALFPFLPDKSRGVLYDFVIKAAVSKVTC